MENDNMKKFTRILLSIITISILIIFSITIPTIFSYKNSKIYIYDKEDIVYVKVSNHKVTISLENGRIKEYEIKK